MTDRKKPAKHVVKSHTKNNKTVRSYSRGSGLKEKKQTPQFMSKKNKTKKWVVERDNVFGVRWYFDENPKITVEVNREETDENDMMEAYGDDYDFEEHGYMFLVFPAYDGRAIPNSPEIFSSGTSGSLSDAKKDAIKVAEKIMKLPIEKIERFDWDMV